MTRLGDAYARALMAAADSDRETSLPLLTPLTIPGIDAGPWEPVILVVAILACAALWCHLYQVTPPAVRAYRRLGA